VTEPAAVPPSTSTSAITVTDVLSVSPFVVSVLRAQRRLAMLRTCTSTMQPREDDAARVRSTISWGAITDRPPSPS